MRIANDIPCVRIMDLRFEALRHSDETDSTRELHRRCRR